MRWFVSLFLIWNTLVFSVDFDCVVVGSSPFSLFEALYQSHSGKRVLILEGASECGGAWKAIDVCGIPRADLGCHQIGHDATLKNFLEEYAGCKLVSLDNPLIPYTNPSSSPNGYYFSQGCFELVDHLLQLISSTSIVLLLNHRLEKVAIDPSHTFATVKTQGEQYTTSKLIVTQMSSIQLENGPPLPAHGKTKYYHLYLLIQDPTPPRFCYTGGVSPGVSRLMNLTHLVGLTGTGQHLIVIQTHSEQSFTQGQKYLQDLKAKKLIGESAYILRSEPYIYEQGPNTHQTLRSLNGQGQKLFETINTGHFQSLSTYVQKWKQVLKPYSVAIAN